MADVPMWFKNVRANTVVLEVIGKTIEVGKSIAALDKDDKSRVGQHWNYVLGREFKDRRYSSVLEITMDGDHFDPALVDHFAGLVTETLTANEFGRVFEILPNNSNDRSRNWGRLAAGEHIERLGFKSVDIRVQVNRKISTFVYVDFPGILELIAFQEKYKD